MKTPTCASEREPSLLAGEAALLRAHVEPTSFLRRALEHVHVLLGMCMACDTYYAPTDAGAAPGGFSHGYCSTCYPAVLARARGFRMAERN